MVKIGFNVLAWSAGLSDELRPIVDRLKITGYDGVEFLIGSPDASAYKRFGDYTQSIEMGVTTVFVVGKDENPASESPGVRAKALDRIKWAIDRAYDLNAHILAGPFHSAHGYLAKRAPEDKEYRFAAEVLR